MKLGKLGKRRGMQSRQTLLDRWMYVMTPMHISRPVEKTVNGVRFGFLDYYGDKLLCD
jgi:hypothetical protein